MLEMFRKVTLTGLLIFISPGSLLQLVVTIIFCLVFLALISWNQPYEMHAANIFKLGTEVALLCTLVVAVLLRGNLDAEGLSERAVGWGLTGVLMFTTNGSFLFAMFDLWQGASDTLIEVASSLIGAMEESDNPLHEVDAEEDAQVFDTEEGNTSTSPNAEAVASFESEADHGK